MWSRNELKETAKSRISRNYWKSVLAALIFSVLCGGYGLFGSTGGFASGFSNSNSSEESGFEDYIDEDYLDEDDADEDNLDEDDADEDYLDEDYDTVDEEVDMILEDGPVTFFFVLICIVIAIALALVLIGLPLNILVFNPLEIGVSRFFTRNLKEEAQVKEVCFAFDRCYKNCVKVTFFRELYIFLWTLLFVIPGIVKSYEYRLVPYILGECPDMEREEVLDLSKTMMYGSKWKSFVLDLSFLGWYLLNGITLGILGVFYLNPYICQTDAALYLTLKEQYLRGRKTSDL